MSAQRWTREDIAFNARDGVTLRGWMYRPSISPAPCIIMTHGFTAVIDQGLGIYAEALATAGFAVLVYDHRNYGRSDGEPRNETNPFDQVHDMRDAITFVTLDPGVDENRIGLWGASFSGGHVLMVGAVDRRARCVVSIVPALSGSAVMKRLTGEANLAARHARMAAARKAEMRGDGVQYQTHAAAGESLDWFQSSNVDGRWRNTVSTLSYDMAAAYEPGDYVARLAPTPLLMVITDSDQRCGTDLQIAAYERALEPKQLLRLSGGHYEVYERHAREVAEASRLWFERHLAPKNS